MRLRLFFHILIVVGVTSVAVRAQSIDWSESTFVVWSVKTDGLDQQSVASLSDWFRVHAMSGEPGVRFILNNIALSGIRTIWWRCYGGGWAHYPTGVDDATIARYHNTGFDEQAFDHFSEAVKYAHKLGMKIYAWFPILEEAHAWPANSRSRYVDLHRDQWDKTVDGKPAGMPSFYYKAYRDYKLKIAKELVTRYAVDGLVLDFERQGAPYRSDRCGYLPQIVSAYKAKTGKDASSLLPTYSEWRSFRADYVGLFVKDVREMLKGLDRPVPLVMMYPADQPLTAHWDVMKWAKLGYFDSFAMAAHGPAGEGWESPTDQAAVLIEEARKIGHPVSLIFYSAGPKMENLRERITQAIDVGFKSIVYFESTHLFWNDRFSVPLSLAMPREATLVSPTMDLTGGGQLFVSAAGKWQLWIDSVDAKPLAEGSANQSDRITLPGRPGSHRLIFRCVLPDNASKAGLAVEGGVIDSSGTRHTVRTDGSWKAQGKGVTLKTIGQPGIPPFLFEAKAVNGVKE